MRMRRTSSNSIKTSSGSISSSSYSRFPRREPRGTRQQQQQQQQQGIRLRRHPPRGRRSSSSRESSSRSSPYSHRRSRRSSSASSYRRSSCRRQSCSPPARRRRSHSPTRRYSPPTSLPLQTDFVAPAAERGRSVTIPAWVAAAHAEESVTTNVVHKAPREVEELECMSEVSDVAADTDLLIGGTKDLLIGGTKAQERLQRRQLAVREEKKERLRRHIDTANTFLMHAIESCASKSSISISTQHIHIIQKLHRNIKEVGLAPCSVPSSRFTLSASPQSGGVVLQNTLGKSIPSSSSSSTRGKGNRNRPF